MPTPDWDTLEPTPGTPGNAYELGLDVKIGEAWVNVPDITALNPQPQPKKRNRSSYAAKGKRRNNTFQRDMNLSFNVEIVRDELGEYQEELLYLLDKAQMLNEDNIVEVRVFDTLGASYAFEGDYTIELSRPNTGDEDAGWWGFALESFGDVGAIANPAEDLDPGIISVMPLLAAVGEVVQVHGRNFTGATAVSVDGVAAFSTIEPFDDRNFSIEIPSGAAGPANIIVTTPEGASVAFPYTVGA